MIASLGSACLAAVLWLCYQFIRFTSYSFVLVYGWFQFPRPDCQVMGIRGNRKRSDLYRNPGDCLRIADASLWYLQYLCN